MEIEKEDIMEGAVRPDLMKTTAIVLAAGSGRRMKSDVKKQYMEIGGKPLFLYSLETFDKSFIDEIILVLPESDIKYVVEEILSTMHMEKIKAVVAGGSTRYHSVMHGLRTVSDDTDYVFIHDGARPFIDDKILVRALDGVKKYGACVIGMPVKDTIKIADVGGFAGRTPDRDKTWMIQTPQVFLYSEIKDLYEELIQKEEELIAKGINITDDAMVMETFGKRKVKLVEGSYDNIKITTPDDIALAESILKRK